MYKLQQDECTGIVSVVNRLTDGISIPFDPANTDYQEYLEWVAEGNTPEASDE
tara:strand:+ start:354 stop:512 length:159 start_codon:yes stop_codon:yes gene_type:complete